MILNAPNENPGSEEREYRSLDFEPRTKVPLLFLLKIDKNVICV
jgi:hypothetical protein